MVWKTKCKNSCVYILKAVGVLVSLMLISARDLGAQLTYCCHFLNRICFHVLIFLFPS